MNVSRTKKYLGRVVAAFDEHVIFPLETMIDCKRRYRAAFLKNGLKRRYILCYPQRPKPLHSFYSICHALGLTITSDPRKSSVAVMHFEDATVRAEDPVLGERGKYTKVINGACNDIGKEKVEDVFSHVFGYGMRIDPRTFNGPCVQKSNRNAANDGQIVECPREPEKGYVYQKLIDTQEGDMAVDMRLSIFNDKLPLAYLRYKHISDRFRNTKKSVRVPVQDILSEDEQRTIIRFCQMLGLDYGELDLIREKSDGKLYIVDANNTPYAPRAGHQVSYGEFEIFLKTASECFAAEFLQ